jgi:hypothetical protein
LQWIICHIKNWHASCTILLPLLTPTIHPNIQEVV